MALDGFRLRRRLWLLTAIALAIGAFQAARAADPPRTPPGRQPPSTQPRLADRLRRWFAGPRLSGSDASQVRHFDAFEFWAMERDERRHR